ncbi:uncharacterized protein [Solanum lycopersicum]|uniref:uncharacterized protein n=1 Tax=Solanum lycopersicum TaxID=4081 RepID=UPI003747DAD6
MHNKWRRVVGGRGREGKKPRPSDQAGSSSGRSLFGVQDMPKVKKGHQNSGNPTPSRNTIAKKRKSCLKKGNDRNAQRDKKSCGKCDCLHGGECLVGTNACYGCGKSGNIIRDFLHVKNQTKADTQPRSYPTAAVEPPKRNRFYALKGREEKEKSTDVVTGNLHVFCFSAYALLDLGSTLYFVTPLVASNFDLLTKILHEPFLVSNPIKDNIRAERVYRDCPIIVLDRVTYADLIDLTILDFDIILGMDWLHKFYATIDRRNRIVRFQFPKELELEREGRSSNPKGQIVSHLKANKMLSKGYLYHLVRFNDLEHEVPSIDPVSIVNEFQDIFPEYLSRIPPKREIDFGVDLDPNTKQISIPPYRMAPAELKELKLQLKDLLDKGFIQPSISPIRFVEGFSTIVSPLTALTKKKDMWFTVMLPEYVWDVFLCRMAK